MCSAGRVLDREECHDHAPIPPVLSNRRAGTVSRHPLSAVRGKTKPRITPKPAFHRQISAGIRFSVSDFTFRSDRRGFSSLFGPARAVLFICSKGELETGLPCPISSVVFLLSPGFSMLLVQKWRQRGAARRLSPPNSSGTTGGTERAEGRRTVGKLNQVPRLPSPPPCSRRKNKKREKKETRQGRDKSGP